MKSPFGIKCCIPNTAANKSTLMKENGAFHGAFLVLCIICHINLNRTLSHHYSYKNKETLDCFRLKGSIQ